MSDEEYLRGTMKQRNMRVSLAALSRILVERDSLRTALGDLVKEMDHLENHGGIGSHKPVLDRARQALTSSEKEKAPR